MSPKKKKQSPEIPDVPQATLEGAADHALVDGHDEDSEPLVPESLTSTKMNTPSGVSEQPTHLSLIHI
ncbi:MAG: hypothetical protein N2545_03840, partial [Thermoflexales bacterium]|nr:hypothetical protein [Thermoflexales bacterium]